MTNLQMNLNIIHISRCSITSNSHSFTGLHSPRITHRLLPRSPNPRISTRTLLFSRCRILQEGSVRLDLPARTLQVHFHSLGK